MPNRFASGKFAIAECDRCSGRYKLKELRTQTVKTKPFKIKVCHECWDPDHDDDNDNNNDSNDDNDGDEYVFV